MQQNQLVQRPARQLGAIAGVAAGILFAVFIGISMHSLLFGLVQGVIFGAGVGLVLAWRAREHQAPRPEFRQWTPGLVVAFFIGTGVCAALVAQNVYYDRTGPAVAWALIGLAYAAFTVAVPSLNKRIN